MKNIGEAADLFLWKSEVKPRSTLLADDRGYVWHTPESNENKAHAGNSTGDQ
jgi:hypothetical protein